MSHSLALLRKWGVTDQELPSVNEIKHIHVYDFDNTLFASPLPNAQLWNGPTLGMLQSQDTFANGGWWHDSNILARTGEGLDKEEAKAWDGWWNGQIVNLVELTMQQKDALNILLTGRSVTGFADLLQRIIKSKGLDFHLISLKPQSGPSDQVFSSTATFKQAFLEDVVKTYRNAVEIRVYEDRPNHVSMFRKFFGNLNQSLSSQANTSGRKPIHAEVIEVTENATTLDPVAEVAEVQRMINAHNLAFRNGTLPAKARTKSWEIKRQVLYTGYLISPSDTDKLLSTASLPSSKESGGDTRTLANNIMITPRPCPRNILDKIGGIGKKTKWRVLAIGNVDEKVWAARVEPVPNTEIVQCEGPVPYVVLAVQRNAKPIDATRITTWQKLPENKSFEFETVIGEKVLLRIDEEIPHRNTQQSHQDYRGFKRTLPIDEEFPALGATKSNPSQNRYQPLQRPDRNHVGSSQDHRPSGSSNGSFNRGGAGGPQRGRGGNQFHGRGGGRGNVAGWMRTGFQRGGGAGGPGGNHPNGRGRGRGGGGGGGGAHYKSLDDGGSRKRGDFGMDGAADEGGLTY